MNGQRKNLKKLLFLRSYLLNLHIYVSLLPLCFHYLQKSYGGHFAHFILKNPCSIEKIIDKHGTGRGLKMLILKYLSLHLSSFKPTSKIVYDIIVRQRTLIENFEFYLCRKKRENDLFHS